MPQRKSLILLELESSVANAMHGWILEILRQGKLIF